MPATPYAKLLASVNSASPTSGGITAAPGDTVELSGESTVGWTQQRFEISDYPTGFACPAGWSTDGSTGAYFYATDAYPPSFTVGVWGKYILRLIVNNGLNGAGESDPSLSDPSPTSNGVSTGPNTGTAISVLSPKGLRDLGFDEGLQFSASKAWTADHKANLRVIDTALGSAVSLSSATPQAVGTTGAAGTGTSASRADHVHALTFATVNALLAGANAAVDLNGQNLTSLGMMQQGPWMQKSVTASTSGGAIVSAAVSLAVATGRATSIRLLVAADDGTYGYLYESGPGTGMTTFGGTPQLNLPTPGAISGFPLSPTFTPAWSAGTLAVDLAGPRGTITATADNGGGKLRLTLASTTPNTVTSAITGVSVDVSGLTGTPGGNGSHTATYVDATHIDLLGVAYVAPDASGTVVETTPRSVNWKLTLTVQ